jgi:hypothetical protein
MKNSQTTQGGSVDKTVRTRKNNSKTNTQRYLPFAEIKNDIVVLKNGGLRAVLQIEPINFNLKSETEQIGIISGYESFINTLVFPVQILVRSTRVDIDPYLALIKEKTTQQDNPLLKAQTEAYGTFIKKVVDVADIMQKRFYVIVPLDNTEKKQTSVNRFKEWMNTDDTVAKVQSRRSGYSSQSNRLKERLDLVRAGLEAIGLGVQQLQTAQLISLYYEVYNRGQRQSQKITPNTPLNTVKDSL